MSRRFGFLLCDRCGKRIMEMATWVIRGINGTSDRDLCEACSVEIRDEIDGHEKATVISLPTELAAIPDGF